jgi:DNA-binding CsgD family transcriptional regulator
VSVLDRIAKICDSGLDARAVRVALLDEIRGVIPFDAYAWLLTDPETSVGSAPLAEIPEISDLPAVIRLKYLTVTNRWTTLTSNVPATLVGATAGDRSTSRMWNELLMGYGFDDVLSVVFRDQYGCWGFLDLWRMGGCFAIEECELLQKISVVVTPALRTCLMPTFADASTAIEGLAGPAVLLLSDDLKLLTQTPHTDAYLRALLPTDADRSPVPAGVYNVAAQLLAVEGGVDQHPPLARVHLRDGLWVTFRAARIQEMSGGAATIAVSIELARPTERADLYARVAGLSEREFELLHHLVGGHDTRAIAGRMFVSEHTVQDHLKSMFAKTGVNTRRLLIARATGLS